MSDHALDLVHRLGLIFRFMDEVEHVLPVLDFVSPHADLTLQEISDVLMGAVIQKRWSDGTFVRAGLQPAPNRSKNRRRSARRARR